MGAIASLAKKFRGDGWLNVFTGLGSALDKREGASIYHISIKEREAEDLYAGDDVAATIVDALPDDALRQWFQFAADDPNLALKIDNELDRLQTHDRLCTAWKWGRLYGGAALLMVTDDSADLSQPLDLKNVRRLNSLTLLSRYDLYPDKIETDLRSVRYNEPITYAFQPRSGQSIDQKQAIVHHSRLLLFHGVKLPIKQTIQNRYWGDSVLTRARNAIRNYNISHDAAALILQEFNQGVFKRKGLADALLEGRDADVQNRLTAVNMGRSVCRAIIIDAEEESYENVAVSLTGIPEMLQKVGQRLVVASKMPHTKILGESPSGLGATGEHELTNWYDFVASQQELVLRPIINRILEVIFHSRLGPTGGKIPTGWNFEFLPLLAPSEKEQIETRLNQARVDEIYIRSNVLDADEVAASRFGGGKYSYETKLDPTARAELNAGDDADYEDADAENSRPN